MSLIYSKHDDASEVISRLFVTGKTVKYRTLSDLGLRPRQLEYLEKVIARDGYAYLTNSNKYYKRSGKVCRKGW